MKHINGIADATKIAVSDSADYRVTVTDGDGRVELSIGGMSFPAALSPEQARKIAKDLRASADRVEAGA